MFNSVTYLIISEVSTRGIYWRSLGFYSLKEVVILPEDVCAFLPVMFHQRTLAYSGVSHVSTSSSPTLVTLSHVTVESSQKMPLNVGQNVITYTRVP
jgi:hypothetical protein